MQRAVSQTMAAFFSICFTRGDVVMKGLIFSLGTGSKMHWPWTRRPLRSQSWSLEHTVSIALTVHFCIIVINLEQVIFPFRQATTLLYDCRGESMKLKWDQWGIDFPYICLALSRLELKYSNIIFFKIHTFKYTEYIYHVSQRNE